MNIAVPTGLGAVIAIIVLVLCVVFAAIAQLPITLACLIAGLAIARLC